MMSSNSRRKKLDLFARQTSRAPPPPFTMLREWENTLCRISRNNIVLGRGVRLSVLRDLNTIAIPFKFFSAQVVSTLSRTERHIISTFFSYHGVGLPHCPRAGPDKSPCSSGYRRVADGAHGYFAEGAWNFSYPGASLLIQVIFQ